jgi:glycosyltransferase involved in cell wall biosynthesis
VDCHHVDARLSTDLEDVGQVRWTKVFRLVGYCLQALWIRFRHGVRVLYYVPTPPKRASLYRDWLVMILCRPFFSKMVFHWHGVGLARWLEEEAKPFERQITRLLLDKVDLAIVLSDFNRADAVKTTARRITVVANGIPDPCAGFAAELAPRRRARAEVRRSLLLGIDSPATDRSAPASDASVARVLFLAHCTRDKGLFDTLEGVSQADALLAAQGLRLRLELTVAGTFLTPKDHEEFEEFMAARNARSRCRYIGFVSGAAKNAAFSEADIFCFPTYFANEGQPVNLIEAMAFGLPAVVTRWRSLPEFMPPGYTGLIEPRHPEQVAKALLGLLGEDGLAFRETYLAHFTLEKHLAALSAAIRSVENE